MLDRLKALDSRQRFIALVTAGVLLLGWFIYAGFDTRAYRVANCTTRSTSYLVAHYSEPKVEVGVDADGTPYANYYDDTWSERVSMTSKASRRNDEGVVHTGGFIMTHGYPVAKRPELYDDFVRGRWFVRITERRTRDLTVGLISGDDKMDVGNDIEDYGRCMAKRGGLINLKTWWGLASDVKFN